jgi:phage-related protein
MLQNQHAAYPTSSKNQKTPTTKIDLGKRRNVTVHEMNRLFYVISCITKRGSQEVYGKG